MTIKYRGKLQQQGIGKKKGKWKALNSIIKSAWSKFNVEKAKRVSLEGRIEEGGGDLILSPFMELIELWPLEHVL